MASVTLTGHFGSYQYDLVDLQGVWNRYPGNYAFLRANGALVDVLYIGECEDFIARPMPPSHERWAEAVRDYGATHIVAHVNLDGELERKNEERDLIAAYNPPMNVQHRTGLPGTPALPLSGALSGLGLINQRGRR